MIDSMHVVDAHCHVGVSSQSGVKITEGELLATMAAQGIDAAMVFPQAQQDLAVVPIHDRIARFAEAHPGVIYGVACLSPRLAEADYRREATRCVRTLGFRAIKLDPAISAMAPNHPCAGIVFAMAEELGVPVIVHTAPGGFTHPSLAIQPALGHPGVTVVLAHAGFVGAGAEAIIAAQVCPNIVLEHSWCLYTQVAAMVRALGAERVMFGSDHPRNVPVELAKIGVLDLDDAQRAQVLGGTARRIFRLDA